MGRGVKIPWVEESIYHGHGIWPSLPMVFWRPIHGISTPLPMVYRPPYRWYIDPPIHGILTPPTHGISTPLHMIFGHPQGIILWGMRVIVPVSYGILNPMVNWPWGQFSSMVYWTPLLKTDPHGILTPIKYLCIIIWGKYCVFFIYDLRYNFKSNQKILIDLLRSYLRWNIMSFLFDFQIWKISFSGHPKSQDRFCALRQVSALNHKDILLDKVIISIFSQSHELNVLVWISYKISKQK
jgi:hypothetical protein